MIAEPDALVVGVRAFDRAPQEIRAPLTRRDQVRRDQDFVAVFEATLRGSVGGVGIESEQKLRAGIIHCGGQRVLSDAAALGIASAADDTRVVSLVFQHRVGLGRNLSLGATRESVQPGGERRDELFFKAAFAL